MGKAGWPLPIFYYSSTAFTKHGSKEKSPVRPDTAIKVCAVSFN
jgi:hypothetical protein